MVIYIIVVFVCVSACPRACACGCACVCVSPCVRVCLGLCVHCVCVGRYAQAAAARAAERWDELEKVGRELDELLLQLHPKLTVRARGQQGYGMDRFSPW